jgi:hypothetical protein
MWGNVRIDANHKGGESKFTNKIRQIKIRTNVQNAKSLQGNIVSYSTLDFGIMIRPIRMDKKQVGY